jgi:excisionase family DNA binding protein
VIEDVEELMTVEEIAAFLKVHASWVYGHTRQRGRDQIPHIKVGKYLRFHMTQVRDWLDRLSQDVHLR